MKPWIQEHEKARAKANIVTGCAIVLFAVLIYQFAGVTAFLSRLVSILFPFIMGFVVAFLLNPPMTWLEHQFIRFVARYFKGRTAPRFIVRLVAAIILYTAFTALLVGFLAIVLPQLVGSIRQLIESMTRYINQHSADIQQFLTGFNLGGESGNLYGQLMKLWNDFASMSLSYTGQLLMGIVNVSASVGSALSEFFIGLIVSIYMLFGKERFTAQAKKLGCAFMPLERVERLSYWFKKTEHIFSGYIVGQILSSMVVGLLTYIFMLATHMEYALLISVIMAVTNIIPVFGPVIGCVIGALILMISSFPHALIFVVFTLVLQQVDGNVIAPRIMGDSIGISSFWIMLSIVVGGGVFGLAGILVGIPVFAVIYALIQESAANRLIKKGLPPNTPAYMDLRALPEPKEPGKGKVKIT